MQHPGQQKAKPKEAWQYETDFRGLHDGFPELVDEQGSGWFVRHVHGVRDFLKRHPEKVKQARPEKPGTALHGWDRDWRDKVIRFPDSAVLPETKGGWVLRFDDVLADALELGPLRSPTLTLPPGLEQRLADLPFCQTRGASHPAGVLCGEQTGGLPPGWCLLPALTPCTTAFSKKWLTKNSRRAFMGSRTNTSACAGTW